MSEVIGSSSLLLPATFFFMERDRSKDKYKNKANKGIDFLYDVHYNILYVTKENFICTLKRVLFQVSEMRKLY